MPGDEIDLSAPPASDVISAISAVIEEYPESEYAAAARTFLGEDDPGPEDDSPKARFLQAERHLLWDNDPDGALKGYQSVVQTYPRSRYAPKAQYAIAWIWENLKRNPRMAREAYHKLLSNYPDTPYAALAREKLGYTSSRSPSLRTSQGLGKR